MPRRLLQLYLGLIAYGVSMVLMLQARLGLMPWDVLHQGIALQGDWPMGRVSIIVGALVLLAWIPIRQRPGFGTVSNVIVIGLVLVGAVRMSAMMVAPAAGARQWTNRLGPMTLAAAVVGAAAGAIGAVVSS